MSLDLNKYSLENLGKGKNMKIAGQKKLLFDFFGLKVI